MLNKRGSVLGNTLFLVAVAALVIWASFNRLAIIDWWWFRFYQPPTEVTTLADQAGLSETGKHWLYRTGPHFGSTEEIGAKCGHQELGCITEEGRVYILAFDQKDEQQTNRAIVTAAHEMLHMAWRRTSQADRDAIKPQLLEAQTNLQNSRLNQQVSNYQGDDEQIDELHSFLGSEYGDLGKALDDYYGKYFSDRGKVIEAALNQPQS